MNKLSHIIIILLMCNVLLAQEPEFTASVDRNPVHVGERITITFAVNGEGSNFKGPTFKGLTVLSGPMQSQSVQIINQRMTRSLSFSYVLTADKTGKFTIDPATITSGAYTLRSNSVKIEVLPESDAQKQNRLQEQNRQKTLNNQAQDILKKNIFLRVEVNKRKVHQGEQLVATYKLYIHPQLNPLQMNPKKIPSFDGFWTQDLNVEKLSWKRELINGVNYNVAAIKQVVLFPQRSGSLNIDPYEFEFIVRLKVDGGQRRRSGSLFDDFFNDSFFNDNYQDFNYVAKSDAIAIDVTPLPPHAPESFAGAVGNMQMNANLDKDKTKTGEPITLKLTISGSGNLKLIEAPKINFPPGFEVYDPKVTDNTNTTISGISGSMVYEYIIIPRNAGEFKIDPIGFTYFDLSHNAYKTLSSPQFNISVEKGADNGNNSLVSGIRKEEVELIGKDIRFIKINADDLVPYPRKFFKSTYFWFWLILPFILLALLLWYKRKRLTEAQDMLQFRTKKATKLSKKRLALASKLMKQNHNDKFYEEINKALWGYISDKLLIPNSDLTKDNVRNILNARNISENSINKFLGTLDEAEFARYAPSTANKRNEDIYKDAVDVITQLEGEIK
ncbi:MAG TPA: BatD family protein [Candidatus Kapabacteria bacterium]|nr:BatD family protein [Candidatus Kapabacteria bacterium]